MMTAPSSLASMADHPSLPLNAWTPHYSSCDPHRFWEAGYLSSMVGICNLLQSSLVTGSRVAQQHCRHLLCPLMVWTGHCIGGNPDRYRATSGLADTCFFL